MSENDSKSDALKNVLAKVNDLRAGNPRVFFGVIGVVLIVCIFMFAGSGTKTSANMEQVLKPGNTYTLYNPNGGEILLTAVPGFGSVERDSEESANVCTAEANRTVELLEVMTQNYITYAHVKVKPLTGSGEDDCKDKKGWTSRIHLK